MIYSLYLDTDKAVGYTLESDAPEDYDKLRGELSVGKRLPENWQLPPHVVMDPERRLCDFMRGYGNAPFVSKSVVNAFEKMEGELVEFKSIGKILGVEYHLMNVIKVIDCLDVGKSHVVYSPDNPERVLYISKHRFTTIPSAPIFRLPQDASVFVTSGFVELAWNQNWTGVDFENAEEIGLYLDNLVFKNRRRSSKRKKKQDLKQ